ncbi:hypothetical protein C8P63_104104 [Melghirimyces profundicolus]|uniref:Sporulation membrane protein YtrI C-terminal domain-containing protein n=1 Tax=Melghirimyces profundicolus TaxID=1242148 RepID=A0A2T6C4K8_9BACL|nr:hypothetical protein [Melghirimyces profundicolus]PTX63259.1 hypothetical protein C8P63_104104 [Melghirimyces profundicolus]
MAKPVRVQLIRVLVTFLFGVVAGLTVMNLLYGEKLDALYLERNHLYYRNNEKYKKIQALEKDLNKHTDNLTIGQDISVEVKLPENESRFYQDKIQQEVQSIMHPFVGKSVHWVSDNPEVLDSLLEKRIIQIQDEKKPTNPPKIFHLKLQYLTFVGSKLKVWVVAHEKPKEIEEE